MSALGIGIGVCSNLGGVRESSVFDFTSISGCVGWFDLQDASKYTNTSGSISAIVNKASSVSWSQATSGARPAYNSTGINGLPSMTFDGVDDTIISNETAVFGALKDSLAHTMFIVTKAINADSTTAMFGIGNTGFSGQRVKRWGLNTSGTGQWALVATNDAIATVNLLSGTSTSTTTPVILEFAIDTLTGAIYKNGGTPDPAAGTTNFGTLTPNQSAIGSRPDSAPDSFYNGEIGELVIYNSLLSSGDRLSVRQALSNKWGIAIT